MFLFTRIACIIRDHPPKSSCYLASDLSLVSPVPSHTPKQAASSRSRGHQTEFQLRHPLGHDPEHSAPCERSPLIPKLVADNTRLERYFKFSLNKTVRVKTSHPVKSDATQS